MTMRNELLITSLTIALATGACADSANDAAGVAAPRSPTQGNTGVTQPGAQDFGLFRQILERGEIPAPETIDAIGFFAEHKLDYPTPRCGDELCVHGLLGVMGNLIDGSNCTMVQIGMNSPIDVSQLERPPLHLVLAIDVSGSMRGAPIRAVRTGLTNMLDELEAGDRVTVVKYSSSARIAAEALSITADRAEIESVISGLEAGGSTNIYDGLFVAFTLAEKFAGPAQQNRVILLSDGVATAGFQDGDRMKALAGGYAKRGIGVTTIGVGTDFDVTLMRDIGEVGAGNFYFLEDPSAVAEVFSEEVKTFLYPIALDLEMDISVGNGYRLAQVHGTNGYDGGRTTGRIELPTLFLAGRTSAAEPIEGGRRGGGGAIMLELIPKQDGATMAEPLHVGTISVSYTDPQTRQRREQVVQINNAHPPGEFPVNGYFTDGTVEKGFIMLNIYAGFRLAAELARDSDVGAARGVLQALRGGVQAWLSENPDPDLADDLRFVDMFEQNLENAPGPTPVSPPPNPFPFD